jgi:hypothetical protein
MQNRHQLILDCTRNISCPEHGVGAYTRCGLQQNYSYGKNGVFKTAQEGINKLTRWAEQNKKLFSEISIIKRNGWGGEVYNIYDIDNRFEHEIKEFKFPTFTEA